jgi:hypothetical protein
MDALDRMPPAPWWLYALLLVCFVGMWLDCAGHQ